MSIAPGQPDRFVNPYTFVSLPDDVSRHKYRPQNQTVDDNNDPLWSGSIEVEWTLETDLLLPAQAKAEGWVTPAGRIRVPGSSAKGVLRSLHETMFNGCLRIVNDEFVPAYREPVNAGTELSWPTWSLAVVTRSQNGRPVEVALCDEAVHVEIGALHDAYERSRRGFVPRTGDLIEITGDSKLVEKSNTDEMGRKTSVERFEMRAPTVGSIGRLTPRIDDDSGDKVIDISGLIDRSAVLATSLSARDHLHPYFFWATAPVTTHTATVSTTAVDEFQAACEGSRDRQVLSGSNRHPSWESESVVERVTYQVPQGRNAGPEESRQGYDGRHPDQVLGERRMATGYLHAGDVIWVHLAKKVSVVDRIKLSQVWRSVGTGNVASRLPQADLEEGSPLRPCGSWDGLDEVCPSCQTFGAIEPRARRGRGEQTAVRGRVRVGGLLSDRGPELTPVTLAPRGIPRPGAGMFYLEPCEPTPAEPGDLPSQWGGSTDGGDYGQRQLRGRKYYWHSDPGEQKDAWPGMPAPRYQFWNDQHPEKQKGDLRKLVPAGTRFLQTIGIDGLSAQELRRLVAVIEPARVLDAVFPPTATRRPRYAHRLGGGKPFGLGSATARLTENVQLTSAASRYRDGVPAPSFDLDFDGEELEELVAGSSRAILGQLARVLDQDGLDGWQSHVAYPPGTSWQGVGTKRFVESFRFFQGAGQQLSDSRRRYHQPRILPEDPRVNFEPDLPTGSPS